jgi:dienelactone hydrolase
MIFSTVTAAMFASCLAGDDPLRVLPPGKLPADERLNRPRNLDDYHPFDVPKSVDEWKKRREFLRTQVLVSQGLWPLPERTPLNAVVRGKIDRGDYTVEKVLLNTRPGHYLAGSLYRPKNINGKAPAVLCPHGHWANGRFMDATEKGAEDAIKTGGESHPVNARYHLQALPATLARFGYVAFAYDMIGVADSKPLNHPVSTLHLFNGGFEDAESILRLDSFMGLQTWNSIRALDFVCDLPDVDPKRIAVTGGSGGGTQTFILAAIDDRVLVSFPTVMVSTAMQGGCVCENAPLLRIGTGNVELAALHAPKPLGMTGADDWTKEIETKGLPELRTLYAMLNAQDAVAAWCMPQFKHNYNQVSRELFYAWANKHFQETSRSTKEPPFTASTVAEMSSFEEGHPRPTDYLMLPQLKQKMRKEGDEWLAATAPKDQESLNRWLGIALPALKAMLVEETPRVGDVHVEEKGAENVDGFKVEKFLLARKQSPHVFPKESVPVVALVPSQPKGKVVVWSDADGKAAFRDVKSGVIPPLRKLLDEGCVVVLPDVYLTGEFHPAGKLTPPPTVDRRYTGYFHGYNRSVLANRAHDLVTAAVFAKERYKAASVSMVGLGPAGVWTILAKGILGSNVDRLAVDLGQWRFKDVVYPDDPRLIPGVRKYGDLGRLALLCAPGPMLAAGVLPQEKDLLVKAYGWLDHQADFTAVDFLDCDAAVAWILK